MTTNITGSAGGTLDGSLTTPDSGELIASAQFRSLMQSLVNNDAELEARVLTKAATTDTDAAFAGISSEFTALTGALNGISSEFTSISSSLPGNSAFYTFYFDPSGSASGNVYTSLSSLNTAISNVSSSGGSGRVILDGSSGPNKQIDIDSQLNLASRFDVLVPRYTEQLRFLGGYLQDAPKIIAEDQVEVYHSGGNYSPISWKSTNGVRHPKVKNLHYRERYSGVHPLLYISSSVIDEFSIDNVVAQQNYVFDFGGWTTGSVAVNVHNSPVPRTFAYLDAGDKHMQVNYYGEHNAFSQQHWTGSFVINYTNFDRSNFNADDGPIGIWNFDDDGLDDSWFDYDLTFYRTPEFVPGHFEGSKAFVSNGDVDNYGYVDASALAMLNAMTIECILYFPTTPDADRCVLSHGEWDSTSSTLNMAYFLFVRSTGKLSYAHENGSGTNVYVESNYSPPIGEWFHMAVTRDSAGTGLKFYINGRKVAEGTASSAPSDSSAAQLTIGNTGDPKYSSTWDIWYSSVRLDNQEKSEQDIYKSYLRTLGRYDRLDLQDKTATFGVTTKKGDTGSALTIPVDEGNYLYYDIDQDVELSMAPALGNGLYKVTLNNVSGSTVTFATDWDGLGNTIDWQRGEVPTSFTGRNKLIIETERMSDGTTYYNGLWIENWS